MPRAAARAAGSASLTRAAVVAAIAIFFLPAGAFAQSATDRSAAHAEAVARALRDYIHASYDVDVASEVPAAGASEEAVAALERARVRLATARTGLVDALGAAGLGALLEGGDLGDGLVAELRGYFEVSSPDLRFLPREASAGGLVLVRVAEQREVPERLLAGVPVAYRVVAWDEAVIEPLERYRDARVDGPVAAAAGRTIFIDRGAARATARDRVIARVPDVVALVGRATAGQPLAPAEVKDVLRHRALAIAIAEGGEVEVARAIAREEEVRLASLFAEVGLRDARALRGAELERAARDATLLAVACGDPRYQAASAIALTLGAPDSAPARGAAQALRVLAGGDRLDALLAVTADDLARRALAARRRD